MISNLIKSFSENLLSPVSDEQLLRQLAEAIEELKRRSSMAELMQSFYRLDLPEDVVLRCLSMTDQKRQSFELAKIIFHRIKQRSINK